jgi:hypothetical protein
VELFSPGPPLPRRHGLRWRRRASEFEAERIWRPCGFFGLRRFFFWCSELSVADGFGAREAELACCSSSLSGGSGDFSLQGCCGGWGFYGKQASGSSSIFLRRSMVWFDPRSEESRVCPRPMDYQRLLHLLWLNSKAFVRWDSSVLGSPGYLLRRRWLDPWRRSAMECPSVFSKHKLHGPRCNFHFC